jgi:thiol-disulfide isomerase/thioredoxin
MRPTFIIIIAAVIALGGGIIARHFLLSPVVQTSQATSPSPDFSFPDPSGKAHHSAEWQGKIRIINFWATWCPPCIKEIPEFINMQKQYGEKGVQFVGIAIEDREPVAEYLKSIAINYPILIGGDDAVALSQQMGNSINAVPFTVVVNREGQIIHRQPGAFSGEQILKIITPLLN